MIGELGVCPKCRTEFIIPGSDRPASGQSLPNESESTQTSTNNPVIVAELAQRSDSAESGTDKPVEPDGSRVKPSVRLECARLLAERLNRDNDELREQPTPRVATEPVDIFEKDMQIRRDRMERDKRNNMRNTIWGISIAFVIVVALTIWRSTQQKAAMQNLPDEIEKVGASSSADLNAASLAQAPNASGEANSSTVRLQQKWPKSFGLAREEQSPPYDPAANLDADGLNKLAAAYGFWFGRVDWSHRIKEEFPQLGRRIVPSELQLTTRLSPAVDNIEAIINRRFSDSGAALSEVRASTQGELASMPLDGGRAEASVLQLEKWATSEIGSLPGIQTLLTYHPKYICNPEREFLDGFTQEFRSDGSGKTMGLKPRIVYPISWIAEDGDRPHIVKKFRSSSSAENVMLHVDIAPPELLEMLNRPLWPQHEVMAGIAEGLVEGMAENQAIEHAEVLDSGAVWIAGGAAGWAEYAWRVNRVGIEFDSRGLLLCMFREGRKLTLTMETHSVKSIDPLSAEQKFIRAAPLYQQMLNMFDLFDRYD
jgi:hypothetical protein